jgi:hypothetical protein
MDEPAKPLPDNLESCHALIGRLQAELEEARGALAAHAANERRELDHRYGKGVTSQSLHAFAQIIGRPPGEEQRRVIEAELAAEDAVRRAKSSKRGKKK